MVCIFRAISRANNLLCLFKVICRADRQLEPQFIFCTPGTRRGIGRIGCPAIRRTFWTTLQGTSACISSANTLLPVLPASRVGESRVLLKGNGGPGRLAVSASCVRSTCCRDSHDHLTPSRASHPTVKPLSSPVCCVIV